MAYECADWLGGCGMVWTHNSTLRRAPRSVPFRLCPDCAKAGVCDE